MATLPNFPTEIGRLAKEIALQGTNSPLDYETSMANELAARGLTRTKSHVNKILRELVNAPNRRKMLTPQMQYLWDGTFGVGITY